MSAKAYNGPNTWAETESFAAEVVAQKLTQEELHNVYNHLPFFVAANFAVIMKQNYGINVPT